jgi:hypothetical protein
MVASTALAKLLTAHYYDASWSKKHQGFRCVCGWLGDDHVSHVAGVLSEAGFIQVVDEVDREFHFDPNEHLNVWTDRPDGAS